MCQTRPSYSSFSARTSSFLRTRVTFPWASPLVSWSRAPLLLPPASLALSSLPGYIPVSCLLAHASSLFSSCPASPNCQRPAGGPASAVEAQLAQQACRVPATSSLALLHFPQSHLSVLGPGCFLKPSDATQRRKNITTDQVALAHYRSFLQTTKCVDRVVVVF